MSESEAVAALDAIVTPDTEYAHKEADEVLLTFVPESVRAAYHRVVTRDGRRGFWYA